jgi:Septum formation
MHPGLQAVQTGPGPSCAMSFRENHWRGFADHHTVALRRASGTPSGPATYTTGWDATPRDRACRSRSRVYGCWRGPRLVGTSSGVPVANAPPTATSTAAASPSASSTGRPLTASQLLPGDCLTGSNLQLNKSGQWPTLVQAVPCDQEHTAEVYYSSNYWPADQAYPGERVKLRQATVRCNKAFHSYVGIPYSQSVFAKTIISPSQAGRDSGDRQLTCIAYKPTNKYPGGAPLHASIRGSAR